MHQPEAHLALALAAELRRQVVAHRPRSFTCSCSGAIARRSPSRPSSCQIASSGQISPADELAHPVQLRLEVGVGGEVPAHALMISRCVPRAVRRTARYPVRVSTRPAHARERRYAPCRRLLFAPLDGRRAWLVSTTIARSPSAPRSRGRPSMHTSPTRGVLPGRLRAIAANYTMAIASAKRSGAEPSERTAADSARCRTRCRRSRCAADLTVRVAAPAQRGSTPREV